MKTFYSAEDIENFADQGQSEICVDKNVVLTDLAKQTAAMLGLRITERASGASMETFNPARPQSVGRVHTFSGKPRGCQRRPAARTAAASGKPATQSRPVVDKLVERIKRIKNQ